LRIDSHGPHSRKGQEETALGRSLACDVVTAAANGEFQLIVTGKLYGGDYIRDAGRANDQRGAAVDRRVPDFASIVVTRCEGVIDFSLQSAPKCVP